MGELLRLNSEEKVRVGGVIKALREENGLTQVDVEQADGIAQGSLSKIEKGTTLVAPRKALDILDSLVATPEDRTIVDGLVQSIPALAQAEEINTLVEQARQSGDDKKYGTTAKIAGVVGVSRATAWEWIRGRGEKDPLSLE